MTGHQQFVDEVHGCLAHLHDLAYLEAHCLAALVAPEERGGRGAKLRSVLLDAIEELCPPSPAQRTAATSAWRRHAYLALRYGEGLPRGEILERLGISPRQASRDQDQAVHALAGLLWSRYSHQAVPVVRSVAARATPPLDDELRSAPLVAEAPLDLEAAIAGVVNTTAPLARSRRARIRVEVDPAAPALALSRTLFRQGLFNLLGYCIEARLGAQLFVRSDREAPGVRLTIRAHRTRGRPPSPEDAAGLPAAGELLAAGQRLFESAGVAVRVGTRDDGDLLVEVDLPAAPQRTVLVIDDNPEVAALFRRYLAGTGFRAVHAASAEAALQLARELRPDVISLDLLMPSRDGWETLEALRTDPLLSDTPILVCSALPENALARALGVTEFLAKPVTPSGLLSALERCSPPAPEQPRPGSPADTASPLRR